MISQHKGPETLAMRPLVLDPYSATLYSSSPQVFSQVQAQLATGFLMETAIERVA